MPAPSCPLPVSARLAWWGTAWLRGTVGPDDAVHAVLGDDVAHVLGPGLPEPVGSGVLGALLGLRSAGADAASGLGLALPVEGDLLGLGGPRELNRAALDAGEAVVAVGAGLALVPSYVGPTVEWAVLPAARRQLPDVGEADRALRGGLLEAAEGLAALDVAKWRPEVADRLMDLRHRATPYAPPGVPARCVDLAARAVQALEVVDLALEDDGAAVSASEARARRDALVPLERAGRRALVAACSPEVWPPA
ncbi:MAG: hypothetical protein CMH83_01850 [Nocardioides sp.]|nr:hypothetical protein [Nocardioides sp.]